MTEQKGPDPVRRDMVYQRLNGFIGPESEKGHLSQQQVRIGFLVERIYQHRLNLCSRTNLDFEDKDLEAMIDAYEQLNRLCANLMYDQGWFDASLTLQE